MKIPFTIEQFFTVFDKYNNGVFPFQLVIFLVGIFAPLLIRSNHSLKGKLIEGFFGLLWIWTGLDYHILFFTAINKLVFVFGAAFIVKGVLILINTFLKHKVNFSFSSQPKKYFDCCLNTEKVCQKSEHQLW